MLPISSAKNAAALTILQQASRSRDTADGKAAGADLAAIANGVQDSADAGKPSNSIQARARINEALFSVNALDVNKIKVDLMERLGKEFGISMENFESVSAYGAAIKRAVEWLKRQDGGAKVLMEIEKKLGLDELGISVDTLVNAMIDPGGKDAERLDAALKEKAGKALEDAGGFDPFFVRADEIGLYHL